MTRTTNARIAGVTYFVYVAAGISMMLVAGRENVTNLAAIFTSFSALALGVTLYAITREQDPDLAMLALACRVLEAVPGEGYIYFAVGNTIFCWLLLRGRMIPAGLAWLGLVGSIVLVVSLLLQRGGLLAGAGNWASNVTWMVSLPTLVFELTFAVWLLTKGVAAPARTRAA
ncbi:MAG: DUF4386 family protein [Vicinamibacterales bacterium]